MPCLASRRAAGIGSAGGWAARLNACVLITALSARCCCRLSVAVEEAAAAFGMAATTSTARGTMVPLDALDTVARLVPKLAGSNCTAEDCLQLQDILYG